MRVSKPFLAILCAALFFAASPASAEVINLVTDNTVASNQTDLTILLENPGTVERLVPISYTGEAALDYNPETGALELVSAVLTVPDPVEIIISSILTSVYMEDITLTALYALPATVDPVTGDYTVAVRVQMDVVVSLTVFGSVVFDQFPFAMPNPEYIYLEGNLQNLGDTDDNGADNYTNSLTGALEFYTEFPTPVGEIYVTASGVLDLGMSGEGEPAYSLELLSPAAGTAFASPPEFTWAGSGYNLYRIYLVLPFGAAPTYYPIPIWTSDTSYDTGVQPWFPNVWGMMRTGVPAVWLVLGVDTEAVPMEIEVSPMRWFTKSAAH